MSSILLESTSTLTANTGWVVVTREGSAKPFTPEKIRTAVMNAYLKDASGNTRNNVSTQVLHDSADAITNQVITSLRRKLISTNSVHIEDIQDMVELAIMRRGDHAVARDFVIFREKKAQRRTSQTMLLEPSIELVDTDGTLVAWTETAQKSWLQTYASDLNVDLDLIAKQVCRELFNGAQTSQIGKASQIAVRAMTERHPDYDTMCARIILHGLIETARGKKVDFASPLLPTYRAIFQAGLHTGVKAEIFQPDLLVKFDLERLADNLAPSCDFDYDTLGISTLAANYLIKNKTGKNEQLLEVPQTMLMRIAMGLALNESEPTERALEFYRIFSLRYYLSSSPSLFNSGTIKPQLSSCFLTTVGDDLGSITRSWTENSMLQKYAGGMGNDWTPVRAMGSRIKGTNGESQGVVPFLKVVNDIALAVNQGGKRPGAVCSYLETWHADIEEFLDLRKNTGDDRRRTHNMNTANWIPDLFMKRMLAGQSWTLFSPDEVPDLHEKYGAAFEVAYCGYETKAQMGGIRLSKVVDAKTLWRKMLTMVFETGHPWITFKDPCNIRSPQKHAGVVHSSNLCTEITLNTSQDEIAVCNLGSVNVSEHLVQREGKWGIDYAKLENTVTVAHRMLDNVIDLNLYNRPQAETSNKRHRPVAMGMMGMQDAFYKMKLAFDSLEAVNWSSRFTEALCYYAYSASAALARERGSYESFTGSDWSKGIVPCDTIALLEKERGQHVVGLQGLHSADLPWSVLREFVRGGMRNSNCVAIAPTATIANITGVDQSIEPSFGHLKVKSNLAGEFTVLNRYLVQELTLLGLWDDLMVAELKGFDGSIQSIERIPSDIRERFKTAFEIDPLAPVEHAAARGRWIDQAQSVNLYLAQASGKAIHNLYITAWEKGLKTTYYLRTSGSTGTEKATINTSAFNAVSSGKNSAPDPEGAVCMIRPGDAGFEACESCQ